MEYLDILIAAILAFFILNGIRKGFFREILGLIGLGGGIVGGILLTGQLSQWLAERFPSFPAFLIPILSFIMIFLAIYLLCRLVANGLSAAFESIRLGWLNRLLGGAVSGLKGAVILSLIFFFLSLLPITGVTSSLQAKSNFFQPLRELVPALYNYFSGFSWSSKNFEKRVEDILNKSEIRIKEETLKFLLYGKSDSTATR